MKTKIVKISRKPQHAYFLFPKLKEDFRLICRPIIHVVILLLISPNAKCLSGDREFLLVKARLDVEGRCRRLVVGSLKSPVSHSEKVLLHKRIKSLVLNLMQKNLIRAKFNFYHLRQSLSLINQ